MIEHTGRVLMKSEYLVTMSAILYHFALNVQIVVDFFKVFPNNTLSN